MTYAEAMIARVSRMEAKREIAKHGASWAEFLADCGDLQEYDGATVLEWLGY